MNAAEFRGRAGRLAMDRRRLLRTLQVVVAIAALAYVICLLDWRHAAAVLAGADLRWLAAAFALSLTAFVPAALRWVVLLRAMGTAYRLVSAYQAYLTGTFYSLAMPGVIGGDAARVWLCKRETEGRLWLIAGSVLTERALGVAALLVILSFGIGSIPAASNEFASQSAPVLGLAVILAVMGLPWLVRLLHSEAPTEDAYRPISRKAKTFALLRDRLASLKGLSVARILSALTLSVAFQLIDIGVAFAISRALGLDLNMTILLVAMPLVYLATVLPVSPGGLGVREATLVVVLAQFGVTASDAALLAVAVFLIRVSVGVVGAVQHLAGGLGLSHDMVRIRRGDS